MLNNDYIQEELLKLMKKAQKNNEVPISALIVSNNKIISRAYNKVESKNNFMNHAEILAIKKAMKKKHNWRLDDCILYVSLEPCSMCREIIKKSRISKVIYFSKQNHYLTEKNIETKYIKNETISNYLKQFFKSLRK